MNRRDSVFKAAIFLLVCGFFWPVLVGLKFYYYRDLLVHVFPMKAFWAGAVLQGDFPLWIPHIYMGSPFLAQIDNAVLYPLNVLFLGCPVERAFGLVAFLNFAAAAYGMFALARRWIGCPWSALIASTSYALGGYLVFIADNPPYLLSGALIPAAFYCLTRALETGALRWIGGLSLVTAVQLSGGDPQTVFYEYLFLALWALLAPGAAEGRPGNRRPRVLLRLLPVLIPGLLMIGLLAVVLLPSVEMIRDSTRLETISLADATGWSLKPAKLTELAVPYIFGLGQAGNLYLGKERPWVNCIFIGLLPLVLIPFALGLLKRDRVARFVFVMLVLGLLVSLGRYTPLYGWLYETLPVFKGFRYPIKSFVFVAFALSLLGGIGFKTVLTGDGRDVRRKALWAFGGTLLFGIVLLALSGGAGLTLAERWVSEICRAQGITDDPGAILDNFQIRSLRSAVYLIVLAMLFLLFRKRWPGRAGMGRMYLTFAVFHLVNLLPVTHEYAFFWTDRQLFDRVPQTVEVIQQDWNGRLFDRKVPPRIFSFDLLINEQVAYDLPMNPWEQHRVWDRTTLTRNNAVSYGLSYFKGYATFEPRRFAAFRSRIDLADLPRLASVFNVEYLIVPPLRAAAPPSLKRVALDEPGPFEMYKNLQARSRAYLVSQGEIVSKPETALDRILSFRFNPRSVAILEDAGRFPNGAITHLSGGSVRYQAFLPDRRILDVQALRDGYLVECEQWHDGWQARLDGRPVPLHRVNYLMRGLEVPKGEHEVVLEYRPRSFRIGKVVSIVSVLLLLILCATGRRLWASSPQTMT